jgi:hypothetical protein
MILTLKDKAFLEQLKGLLKSKDLSIELKKDGLKRLVLRQNYGDKIETTFGMSRQGVRWRFQRLFNEIYVGAYESIYMVENLFGTDLRPLAIEIAKERAALRKQAQKIDNFSVCRLKNKDNTPKSDSL